MPSTWTTSKPQGTTKIRMLPNICQDRWTNIQQGEVPSTKWQLARRAGNPGAIPSSGLIFTKDGGASVSELFYKDDAGVAKTTRITTDGGIGSPSQAVNGSTYITLQSDLVTTFTNTQDGFCSAAGRIATDGSLQASYGIASSTLLSTGKYRVTFTTPMTTAENYSIVVTARKPGNTSDTYTWHVNEQNANYFEVKFRKWNPATPDFDSEDIGFMFAVFMSRI